MRTLAVVLVSFLTLPVGEGLEVASLCAADPQACRQALRAPEGFDAALINRMVGAVDPHARVIGQASLSPKLGFVDDGLSIRKVYLGSPADRAGLRVGDHVVGRRGDTLEVERGAERFHVAVKAEAMASDVATRTLDGGVGYVQINRFANGVCEELRGRLRALKARALVLDLRGNPGGIFGEGRCVAGLLIGGFARVVTEGGAWQATWETREFSRIPLAVLIDEGSASAAELVAAALQDHGRALIVGMRSFGKGSVQEVREWPSQPSLKFAHTVALFYRPAGGAIQFQGVRPDVVVPASSRRFTREEDLFGRHRALPLLDQMPSALTAAPSDPARWSDRPLLAALKALRPKT